MNVSKHFLFSLCQTKIRPINDAMNSFVILSFSYYLFTTFLHKPIFLSEYKNKIKFI